MALRESKRRVEKNTL